MTSGFPDWTKAIVLLGWDGTNFIPVLLDDEGNLNILMKGEDAIGDLHMVRVDTDGQIIMVPRGQSGYYMEVDADGYMTTVIKGDFGGDLRTVGLDDEGRLNAFVYDTMDAWGRISSVGMAEVAARLGSMMCYDRRGQVILAESFANGLGRWTPSAAGTGASIAIVADYFMSDGYSVLMVAPSDDGNDVYLYYYVGLMPTGNLGLETSFAISSTILTYATTIRYRDGARTQYAGARFDDSDDDLDVMSTGGAWVKVADVTATLRGANRFNHLKVVADFDTEMYVRVLFNQQEYDISDVPVYAFDDSTTPRIGLLLALVGRNTENDSVRVDNVVLTVAEPE